MLTQTERLGRSYHLHLPGANRSVAIVVILLAFLTGVTLEVAYERGVVAVDWNATGLELVWRQCLELSPNAHSHVSKRLAAHCSRFVGPGFGNLASMRTPPPPHMSFPHCLGSSHADLKNTDMIAKHVVQNILNLLFC